MVARQGVTPAGAGSFVDRYRRDPTEPSVAEFARDVAVRGLLPALALWCVVVALGWVLRGPLGGLPAEAALNRALQDGRHPVVDVVALVVSHAAGVVAIPLVAIIAFFVLRRRTGQWWLALVPLVSVALEALVYQTAAIVVGRPRPAGVEQLDFGGATFSFPSGHVGATVCLGLVFTWLAWRRHGTAGHVLMLVGVGAAAAAVAVSRLYLGMHHASDTVAGALVGVAAASIGWHALRRR